MLIQLAPEVWMDILDWLIQYRKEVALKFSQLVGDRQFSEIGQKWLHECTKNVQLGELLIMDSVQAVRLKDIIRSRLLRIAREDDAAAQRPRASLYRHISAGTVVPVQFAEMPMPENVADFKRLALTCLDQNALQFVRRMERLFAAGIHLVVIVREPEELAPTQTALVDHVFPLLAGIESMVLISAPQLLFSMRTQFPAKLSAIKYLFLTLQDATITQGLAALILDWLCEQRADGEPRIFLLNMEAITSLELIEMIRENFLLSTIPISFSFSLCTALLGQFDVIQETTIPSHTTDEQLIIQKEADGGGLWIGRCPPNAEEWLLEMGRKAPFGKTVNRKIELEIEAVGQMEATDLAVAEESAAADASTDQRDQQPQPAAEGPGSSKKRRLT